MDAPIGQASTSRRVRATVIGNKPERVVETALALLTKTAYDQIQMREIAESAGVSIATVYRHFASKELLFAHALRLWVQRFTTRVGGRPLSGATDEDRLADVFARSIRAFERAPTVYSAFPPVEACQDARVQEIYSELAFDTSQAYVGAIRRLHGAAAVEVIQLCNAILNQNLRTWSLGRCDITDVYDRVDRGVRLLILGAQHIGP